MLRCFVTYNKYGGYCVPESSQNGHVAAELLAGKVWEEETIQYMLSVGGEGDIIHAGAYMGDFLPALSRGCAPGSKVWAFEPGKEHFRCAKITCEINGLSNVALINAGVGERSETVVLRTADAEGAALGGSCYITGDTRPDAGENEAIRIVTIDETVAPDRKVSIIQLDVEGYEQQALAGALGTIRRTLPVLILEDWPESSFLESDWFRDQILRLGYRQVKTIYENVIFEHVPPGEA